MSLSPSSRYHCSRSGAKFAFEKGKWFNHTYLQNISDAELAQLFKPVLQEHGIDPGAFSDEYIAKAVGLVKSRINFVKDLWNNASFFFKAPEAYDPKAVKKRWTPDMPAHITELVALLEGYNVIDGTVEPAVMDWITGNGLHMGNVMNAFRLCVVGECKGPHMFDITALLGKEETLRRLRLGLQRITPADE